MAGDTQNAGWAAKCLLQAPTPEPLSCLVVASRDKSERHPQQSQAVPKPLPLGEAFQESQLREMFLVSPQRPVGSVRPDTPARRTGYSSLTPSSAHQASSLAFLKHFIFNPSPTPSFLQQMLTSHQLSVLGLKLPGNGPTSHSQLHPGVTDATSALRHSVAGARKGFLEAVVTKGAPMHE